MLKKHFLARLESYIAHPSAFTAIQGRFMEAKNALAFAAVAGAAGEP